MTTNEILHQAVTAKKELSVALSDKKNSALREMAASILSDENIILNANKLDLEAAKGKMSDVMLDRLTLNKSRIKAMAAGIVALIDLKDPVHNILDSKTLNNGLLLTKITVPIGVIAIIYESRPNVTSDAAALAIKSGNVCVLRGGRESYNSNKAIVDALRKGLVKAGLPEYSVSLIEDTSRTSAMELMTAVGLVDLLIPRGGKGLISACVENAKVPCIETGTGICHVYVDGDANIETALKIINNAKASRPSVCNAAEVCLVDRKIAADFLPKLQKALTVDRAEQNLHEVELRLDKEAQMYTTGCVNASVDDFDTEFLDYILAVKVVDGVDDAIKHIGIHSTGHSEAIITENTVTADKFTEYVDSAAVYVNASTRFTDGGEFGLGCEMGISTQKIHVRGPIGLDNLTSYKYIIKGNGQIR